MNESSISEIDAVKAELNGRIDVLNEKIKAIDGKIEQLSDDLGFVIEEINFRISDVNSSVNRWFSFTAIVVAIAAPLLLFIIERFLR